MNGSNQLSSSCRWPSQCDPVDYFFINALWPNPTESRLTYSLEQSVLTFLVDTLVRHYSSRVASHCPMSRKVMIGTFVYAITALVYWYAGL